MKVQMQDAGEFSSQMAQATHVFVQGRHGLMAFIMASVRNSHLAEEIFQNVWLKLVKAVERGDEIRDVAKWCRQAARFLILEDCRRQRTDKVIFNSDLLPLVEEAFEEAALDGEVLRLREAALNACLERLPERSVQLLKLRYHLGHSIASIGEQLSQPTETVKKALLRIRQALRVCVRGKLDEMES